MGLGAMFTKSYSFHNLAANTVFCGKMSPECIYTWKFTVGLFVFSQCPLFSLGFLMLLITIMSIFHLVSDCLHKDNSNKPSAIEAHMRFEILETVCQPAGSIQHKPLKWPHHKPFCKPNDDTTYVSNTSAQSQVCTLQYSPTGSSICSLYTETLTWQTGLCWTRRWCSSSRSYRGSLAWASNAKLKSAIEKSKASKTNHDNIFLCDQSRFVHFIRSSSPQILMHTLKLH